MIFRKDNRGESFQRQISGLRKQLQADDDLEGNSYPYAEPQDTSQFTSTSSTAHEESYASTRATEDRAAAPSIAAAQPTTSFRPSWQTADANTSVIASNAHWNGTLRTEGSLHVHGKADGELHAVSDVFVAEGAEVDAQLFADNVVVAGIVRGTIEARGRLELLPQGHVAGDVKAPKLVVHEGARLSGQLKMESGGSVTYSSASESPAPKPRRSGQ